VRRPLSRREWWFVGSVGLQLVILVGMVVFYQAVVSGGTEIVLRTVPVDPRDLLRGQYVALRYEISTVRPELVRGGAAALRPGESVYVVLEDRGDAWEAREVGRERPSAGTFVRGTVTGGGPSLSLRYGIESYFVTPERARELEASARRGMLRMRVAVDREGHAVLRGVAE
jgi:uncharacterized membrane-anchored protein